MNRIRVVGVVALALTLLTLLLAPLGTPRPAFAQNLVAGYIAVPFRGYYEQNGGALSLGNSQTGLLRQGTMPVQYFDKGRLEDHSASVADPAWRVQRGRLTVELMERTPQFMVSGSTTSYAELKALGATMHAPPEWFTGGTGTLDDGTIFVPYDAALRPAHGYIVPPYFWQYLNRADVFPAGWLAAAGLPVTDVFPTIVYKDGVPRQVMMQAYERIVLTYDAMNPADWQVEMGNIGWDAMVALGLVNRPQGGAKRIEISLARQWLYAYEGDEMVFDAPVTTGKDDWETPTGSFSIFYKVALTDMKGEDKERGEKWEVKNVPHAMYFREGGFAIHGAYWHNMFGSGVRLSHGCVNLPLDAAEMLYNWAPVGTSVVVY
jgi:lipoprotein-anchoring transpeptidase ErfK/SrfK